MPGTGGVGAILTPGSGPGGPGPLDMQALKASPTIGIAGVTRDSNGNPLAACDVKLFRTRDNQLLDERTSDGNGNYLFPSVTPGETYYVVAYLTGSPDVEGTTVKTLVGI